jgi:tetratricopeptide (TPR) repeat protein
MRSAWLEDSEAPRLVEGYLAAVERRVDLDLADGRHGELVAQLQELVARYPLRESLWVRLLVVLDRGGRQAEALERYETIRVRLAEELGADPGPDLQRIHADLLAGREPEVSEGVRAAARRQVPRQLPVTSDRFTGRDADLAMLCELFGDVGGSARPGATICVISGMAGVGKTALAVHAAQALAERFPDGQLYVNLQGATPGLRPLPPLEVLGRFLRALGTDPGAVPTNLEEASSLFRSRVAGRRLLLVLDDADDAVQVTPLIPASPDCGVMVTSRRVLPALEGAAQLHLDVLGPLEALELLGRLAGQERVAAEPEAAAEVARCCGWLPLALRIAGARLAARPNWPVRALADRLADAQRRLDELELAEVGVRASFTVSYEQLRAGRNPVDGAAAEAFVLTGVLDGPEFGVPVAARLLDMADDAAERILERLVDAQLLETPAPGRYRLHDLLRLYARELASQKLLQHARAAALTRALTFYVASAWHTLELLRPGDHRPARVDDRWRKDRLEFADEQEALRWLETERANLVAAVQQAATTPGVPAEISVQLAQALFGFFYVHSHWDDCEQVSRTVLAVAQRTGDRAAAARAYNDLGVGYLRQGRYDRSLACHQDGVALYRELGDRYLQAISLHNLGVVYVRLDRYEEALARQQESLHLFKGLGDLTGEAECLNELGVVYQRQGRYDLALSRQRESLAIRRELGDRLGHAECLRELGVTLQAVGRFNEARAHWLEALAIFERLRRADALQLRDLLAELPTSLPR